jgi:hypothetical protein
MRGRRVRAGALRVALGASLLGTAAIAGCLLVDSFGGYDVDGGNAADVHAGGDARADGPISDARADGTRADSSGCIADTGSDPLNCGICGHSCLGGGCADGLCTPVTLIAHLRSPWAIAVTPTAVYAADYVSDAGLYMWQDGSISTVATNQDYPRSIAVTATNIYWTTEKGLRSCPLPAMASTCTPTTIGPAKETDVVTLAVDGGAIFWTSKSEGEIWTLVSGGEAGVVIGGLEQPLGVVDYPGETGGQLFWTSLGSPDAASPIDAGAIGRASTDGSFSAPTFVPGQNHPQRVVLGGPQTLVWTNQGSPEFGPGAVMACRYETGFCQGLDICATLNGALGVVANATTAYFTWQVVGGGVFSLALSPHGGCVLGSAKEIVSHRPEPAILADDTQYLYWTEYVLDGSVQRVAK